MRATVRTDTAADLGPTPPEGRSDVARQIRGSSLLLVGRLLSLGANLAIQVVLVRQLAKADYGMFAYALSVVTMIGTIITLGLDRGISRFVAVFREREETAKLWGTIALQVATIVGLGTAVSLVVIVGRDWIGSSVVHDRPLATLLAVMVLVAPVQALDDMIASIFAAFGESRAIFVRRYLLGPALRLAVVVALVVMDGGVLFFGAGYLIAGALGLAFYGRLLTRMLRAHDLADSGDGRGRARISFPIREVAAFTVPLLATDAMFVVLSTSDVVILRQSAGSAAVASYRAILPLARLNQLVMNSFSLLIGPMMARLWARGDRRGLEDAYWQSAGWVAVLSFPIFAVTFGMAAPVTELLFGHRYAASAPYLQIVAIGFYFNAVLGFNGVTLKMLGEVWLAARIALLALAVNLGANLLLIPRYGPLGAAIGTCVSVSFYNVAKQVALHRSTGVTFFDGRYAELYATILGAVGALLVSSYLFHAMAPLALVAAAACAVVLLTGRRALAVGETFPEIARIPVLGPWLVSGGVAR